jgi:hypothetical protein
MTESIIVNIIANLKIINYGDNLPTLTYTITFSDNDSNHLSDIIIGNNPLSLVNQEKYNVGTYDINIDTLKFTVSPNSINAYTFQFTNSIMTVNPKQLSISANNLTTSYTGLNHNSSFSIQYSGFVTGEDQTILNGTITYNTFTNNDTLFANPISGGAINVGTYKIIPLGLTSTNYDIIYTNGILTINKVPLNITANNVSTSYTGLLYTDTYSVNYSGFITGESISNLEGQLIFGGTSSNAINGGTYTIIPSGYTSNNYNIIYNNGTLTINTVPLTITANNITTSYTGSTYAGTYSVSGSGFVGNDTLENLGGTIVYDGTCKTGINVNTYTIIPSGLISPNYNITYVNGTLIIQKVLLTVSKNSGLIQYVYGNPIDYSNFYIISGFINGENSSVINGTPTVFINNVQSLSKYNVGTYTNITINNIDSLSATNYSFLLNTSSNSNSYTLKINAAPLSITPIAPSASYVYGNNQINYTDLYSITGFVNNENVILSNSNRPTILINSVAYTYGSSILNVGTFPIQIQNFGNLNTQLITGTSVPLSTNYTFIINNPSTLPTITITKANINITILSAYKPYYGDTAIQTSLFNNALKFNGLKYTDTVSTNSNNNNYFNITFTLNTDNSLISNTNLPSVYNVTINVLNFSSTNYTYTLLINTYDLTIQPAILTIKANNVSKVYDGLVYTGPLSVTYSGFVNGDTESIVSGTVTYSGNYLTTNYVTSGTITPSGLSVNSNYVINYVDGILSITKAPLIISPKSPSTPYNYGNSYINYIDLVTFSGFVNGEKSIHIDNIFNYPKISFISSTSTIIPYTYGYTSLNVGTYSISVTSLTGFICANYSITISNPTTLPTLTVNQVPITITINPSYMPKYGDTNIQTTLFNNALTFSGIQYNQSASNISTGKIKFNLTSDGTLVNSTTVPNNYNVTVDISDYVSKLTSNYSSIISYNSVSSSTSVSYDLTIQKTTLTVTASNISTPYTSSIYSGSYIVTYSGFVNSENQSVLGGTLTYGGTSTTGKDVGTYTIIPSGYTSSNYNFTYVQGILTITKVPLTITADNKSMNYTSQIYSGGYSVTYTGFVGIETQSVLGGTLTYSGTCITGINTNTYTIIPSGLTSINYNITYINGSLTINKSPLTITADNKTINYTGTPFNSCTVSYSGFVGTENQSVTGVLTGSLSYSGTYSGSINTGIYTIIPSGLTSLNYNITYMNGSLIINKVTLIVNKITGSVSFIYGNTIDYSTFYQISGFVNSETLSVVTGIANVYVSGVQGLSKYNVGTYSNITINDVLNLSATNYLFSLNNSSNTNSCSLIITKAPLTVSPKNPPSTYIYGNNTINYNDLYTVSGYKNGDDFSSLMNNSNRPNIKINSVIYTYSSSQINVGTYSIQVHDQGSMPVLQNYSYTISNPTTLPTITIIQAPITININSGYQPYYGDSNIQDSLFRNSLSFTGLKYGQTMLNISTGIVTFKTTSNNTLISSSNVPGIYNVIINISDYVTKSTNNYTFNLQINTYNLTIQKAILTISPVVGSTYIKNYGETYSTSEINSLYQITGFIGSDGNQSTVCTGIPSLRLYDPATFGSYACDSTTIIPYNGLANYLLYVNNLGTLQVNPTSNYNLSISTNNNVLRQVQISKISIASKSLVFTWNKYVPPIAYGIPLTAYQLNAITPLNPYTNTPIGTVSYTAQNTVSNATDSTNFYIGGIPNIGTYILTAFMTVTDTNFIVPSSRPYVINSSYPITVLPNYPLISSFNPLPIPKNSALTSVQLNATCNSTNNPSTDIKYVDDNGNNLTVGTVVSNNTGITQILNNYSNNNFYPKYTFRKIKLDTL